MISSEFSDLLFGILLTIVVLLALVSLFSMPAMLMVGPLVVVILSSDVAVVIVFFLNILVQVILYLSITILIVSTARSLVWKVLILSALRITSRIPIALVLPHRTIASVILAA